MTSNIRAYVASFRVRELQECLTQLQLPIKGKKAELQARLFAYLGEASPAEARGVEPPQEQWKNESAKRIVVATYNKMKGTHVGVPPPPPPGQPHQQPLRHVPNGFASSSNAAGPRTSHVEFIPAGGTARSPAGTVARSGDCTPGLSGGVNGRVAVAAAHLGKSNTTIRCLCEVNNERGEMIQCEGERCGVWQHCSCIGINPSEHPEHYYCEMCRMAWADPFWEIVNGRIMPPVRMTASVPVRGPGGMMESQQVVDRSFHLQHAQIELQRSPDQQLQAVCLLLGDVVPFRFHWPQNMELRINDVAYKPYGRPVNQKIGNNVRDEAVNLERLVFAGRNRLRLMARDVRKFCAAVLSVRRRSLQAVKDLMAPEETLDAALERVMSQVGGDEDLEIHSTIISLRCPLSGSRVGVPARFVGVQGLVAFDLETFLSMAERSRKWQCPHSMRHTHVHQLQRDTFIAHILDKLQDLPDVMDVEVAPNGTWRPANGRYPWSKITDPLPEPLPECQQVKPEPQDEGAGLDNSDSEELSEGEELRRAAHAYASTSKQPARPEVIVLDDSSDDDVPPPPPKRPHLGDHAGIMNGRIPHPSANGSSSRPFQGAAAGSTSSSGEGGYARRYDGSMMSAGNQGAQQPRNGLTIRLPSRPQVMQPSRLSSAAASQPQQASSAGRNPPQPPQPFPAASQPVHSRGYHPSPSAHLHPRSPAYSGSPQPGVSHASGGGMSGGFQSLMNAASRSGVSQAFPGLSQPSAELRPIPDGAATGPGAWGGSFNLAPYRQDPGNGASQGQHQQAGPYTSQNMQMYGQEPQPPLPPWDAGDEFTADDAALMGALLGDGLSDETLLQEQPPPPPRRVHNLQTGPKPHISLSSGPSWQTSSVPSGGHTISSSNPIIELDSD